MRHATREDFEGVRPDSMYTQYRRYDFFRDRANVIAARYPASVGKVLVAGCGYGYLVEELFNRTPSYDAWGADASPYAVGKSLTELGTGTRPRVVQIDCLDANQLSTARQRAGLRGNARFGLVVTEDILPVCANDAEVTTLLARLRAIGTSLFHIVTPGDPTDPAKLPGVLWKPIHLWKAAVGTDPVLDTETGRMN